MAAEYHDTPKYLEWVFCHLVKGLSSVSTKNDRLRYDRKICLVSYEQFHLQF